MNTPVTMHFSIEEMYASETAKRLGIDNKPSTQKMINLVYLCAFVLEPLRVAMGKPIKISSGYRPSSRDEGLRLLHGLETNLATSLQTPQEA